MRSRYRRRGLFCVPRHAAPQTPLSLAKWSKNQELRRAASMTLRTRFRARLRSWWRSSMVMSWCRQTAVSHELVRWNQVYISSLVRKMRPRFIKCNSWRKTSFKTSLASFLFCPGLGEPNSPASLWQTSMASRDASCQPSISTEYCWPPSSKVKMWPCAKPGGRSSASACRRKSVFDMQEAGASASLRLSAF